MEKEPNESLQLQPIKERGAYTSASEYFEVLFRLLRADCFQSLKEGINKFLNNTLDRRDLNVYFDVTIVGIHVSVRSKICLAVRLRFTIFIFSTISCILFLCSSSQEALRYIQGNAHK